MSREIELKVQLSEEHYTSIENIILGKSQGVTQIRFHTRARVIKSDEYFSLYRTHEERIAHKELKVIRIRTERTHSLEPSGIDMYGDDSDTGGKSYFCIKHKTLENGMEFNSEHETFVENPDVLRTFFAATGYTKWFEKQKNALSCFCSLAGSDFEAHLEVERVNGLPYAEIEYTRDDVPPETVRPQLCQILRALGVDETKRDHRSWAEILENGKVKTEK